MIIYLIRTKNVLLHYMQIITSIHGHLLYTDMMNSVVKNVSIVKYSESAATIGCSFLNNQSFYCMVCCSTDPSVPPDTSVHNISSTRGTEVTVDLGGLTSGQMYYCRAVATNIGNSTNCLDSVIGGVRVFFSLKINFPLATTYSGMCNINSN